MLKYEDFIREYFSNIFNIEDYLNFYHKDTPWDIIDTLEINPNVTSISGLEGIEKLPNLEKFYINRNDLTNLSGIENCTKLVELSCAYNKLTSVDGLQHINVKKLWIQKNQLTKIDNLSKLKSLEVLNCADNKIESLDGIEELSNLVKLICEFNKIDEIENIPESLKTLKCYGNELPYEDLEEYWIYYYGKYGL